MTFEPTFDDLEKKSSQLPDVAGDIEDVELDAVDRDLAGDADLDSDEAAVGDVAEGEAGLAAATGDVVAEDLPPYGEE